MDFDSLKSRARKCLDEARYWWLAIVLLEVIFLAAVCAKLFWPSPESREFLKLASIAVVVGLAYSFFGIRQCLNANKSEFQTELDLSKRKLEKTEKRLYVCHGLLDEAKRNFVNAEVSNDRLKKRLDRELEDAHKETNLYRDLFNWAKRRFVNAEANNDRLKKSLRWSLTNCRKLRKELSTTKRELEDAYNNLDSAYDMLRDKSVAVDKALQNAETLQDRLNTARRISVRRLIERNELQDQNDGLRKELHEAKMDLEWSRGLRADAKEQAASLENVLKNLDEATEIADLREKLKMVINRLSSEDSRE